MSAVTDPIRDAGRSIRRSVGLPVQSDIKAAQRAAEQRAQQQIEAQQQRAEDLLAEERAEEEKAETTRRRQLRGGLAPGASLFEILGQSQTGSRSQLG